MPSPSRSTGAKQGWRRRLLAFCLPAVLPLLVLAALGTFIWREHREALQRWRLEEAEQTAQAEARGRELASESFGKVLESCRDAWRNQLSIYHQPAALAWTRAGLDGYFTEGIDYTSWRLVHCAAAGVERGPRVVRPLAASLPAEQSDEAAAAAEERWSLALHRLDATPLELSELAVEMLPHPLTGEVMRRRWRGVEGGAVPELDPTGSPDFPLLIAEPGFPLAPGTAPPPLTVLPRHRWNEEPEAALDAVERAIPVGATVVELRLTEDEIAIRIDWPTPAFDGDPPMPYGDLDLDEYGIAESSWWYPRGEPGFGCPRGRPVSELRTELAGARKKTGGAALERAWYSCSPAHGDGHGGVWNLVTR